MDIKRAVTLLKRIARHDNEALKDFYCEFGSSIYKTALRVLNNKTLAEDILNETLLKVYEKSEFLIELKNPLGYICVIAYNLSLDYMRKFKEIVINGHYFDTEKFSDGETNLIEKIFIDEILKKLIEPDRTIFILRASYGYSFFDIKKILTLNTWSYKQIRTRYEKIKELFKKYYNEGNL